MCVYVLLCVIIDEIMFCASQKDFKYKKKNDSCKPIKRNYFPQAILQHMQEKKLAFFSNIMLAWLKYKFGFIKI